MSADLRRKVILVGGPDAGKSNYLFRFWMALTDGTCRPLVRDGLPEDIDHLRGGVDALMQARFARHTPKDSDAVCEIPVLVAGEPATLVVPDRPGEDWVKVYETRRWTPDLASLAGSGAACLVFVRVMSEMNVAPLDWISLRKYIDNAENLERGDDETSGKHPTQVILTDWLQMLAELLRCPGVRPRIAVVVAAFDLLSDDEQEDGPSAYLRLNFRLLSDFLAGCADRIDHAVFGTSLLGCDPGMEPAMREHVLDSDPRSLGYVTHELTGRPARSTDLTLPVLWALGVDLREAAP